MRIKCMVLRTSDLFNHITRVVKTQKKKKKKRVFTKVKRTINAAVKLSRKLIIQRRDLNLLLFIKVILTYNEISYFGNPESISNS